MSGFIGKMNEFSKDVLERIFFSTLNILIALFVAIVAVFFGVVVAILFAFVLCVALPVLVVFGIIQGLFYKRNINIEFNL